MLYIEYIPILYVTNKHFINISRNLSFSLSLFPSPTPHSFRCPCTDRRLPSTAATAAVGHDYDELKYSAEEKTIVDEAPTSVEFEEEEEEEEDETVKKTVADRRAQISKRLSIERQIPASAQKKEIVQEISEIKRHSFIDDKRALHEEEINQRATTVSVIKPTANTEQIMKIITARIADDGSGSKSEMDRELESKFSSLKDEQDSAVVLGEDGQEDDDDATKVEEPEEEEVHITSVETLVKMHEQSQFVQETSERTSHVTSKVLKISSDGSKPVVESEIVQKDVQLEQTTDNKSIVQETVLTKMDDKTTLAETILKSEQQQKVQESSGEMQERKMVDLIDAASVVVGHDQLQETSQDGHSEQSSKADVDESTGDAAAYVKFVGETKEEHNVLEAGISVGPSPVDSDSFVIETVKMHSKRSVESTILEEGSHKETTVYKETEKESTFLDSDVESERDPHPDAEDETTYQKDAGIFSEEHSEIDEQDKEEKLVAAAAVETVTKDDNIQSCDSQSTTSLITEKIIIPAQSEIVATEVNQQQELNIATTTVAPTEQSDLSPERDLDFTDADELLRRRLSRSSIRAGSGSAAGGESDGDFSLAAKPTPEQLQTPDETVNTDINIDSGISVKVTEEMKDHQRYGEIQEETCIAEPSVFEKSEKDNTFSMSSMESDPEISTQCVEESLDALEEDDEETHGKLQYKEVSADFGQTIVSTDNVHISQDIDQSILKSSVVLSATKNDVAFNDKTDTMSEQAQTIGMDTVLDNHAPELDDLPTKVVFTIGQSSQYDDDVDSELDKSFVEHSIEASDPLSMDSNIVDAKSLPYDSDAGLGEQMDRTMATVTETVEIVESPDDQLKGSTTKSVYIVRQEVITESTVDTDDESYHREITSEEITKVTVPVESILIKSPTVLTGPKSAEFEQFEGPTETTTTTTKTILSGPMSIGELDDFSEHSEIITEEVHIVTGPVETTKITTKTIVSDPRDFDDISEHSREIITTEITKVSGMKTTTILSEPISVSSLAEAMATDFDEGQIITKEITGPTETTTTVTTTTIVTEPKSVIYDQAGSDLDDFTEHIETISNETTGPTETITTVTTTSIVTEPKSVFYDQAGSDLDEFTEHSETITKESTGPTETITTVTTTSIVTEPKSAQAISDRDDISVTKVFTDPIETTQTVMTTSIAFEPKSIIFEQADNLSELSEIITKETKGPTESTKTIITTSIVSEPKSDSIDQTASHDDFSEENVIITKETAEPTKTTTTVTTTTIVAEPKSVVFDKAASDLDDFSEHSEIISTETTKNNVPVETTTTITTDFDDSTSATADQQFVRKTTTTTTVTETSSGGVSVKESRTEVELPATDRPQSQKTFDRPVELSLESSTSVASAAMKVDGGTWVESHIKAVEYDTSITDDTAASSEATGHGIDTEFGEFRNR